MARDNKGQQSECTCTSTVVALFLGSNLDPGTQGDDEDSLSARYADNTPENSRFRKLAGKWTTNLNKIKSRDTS